jgi:DeoR/GlpR family transcriptional regulator of sugar metabolism
MKTKEKILDFVRKKPMCTVEEITGELHVNHETVMASLNTLKKKGKVNATEKWPAKYTVPPKKPIKGNDGKGFMEYVEELNRKYEELKAENKRLHGELQECRRKMVRLAQRIVRQDIYGKD